MKFAAVAGSVAETVIVLDDVDDCLLSLVTVIVTVKVPPRVYRWVVVTPDPGGVWSPKSHAYVAPWTGAPGLPGPPGKGVPLAVKITS